MNNQKSIAKIQLTNFKVGDVVIATEEITRKDFRSRLHRGEAAKITAVWRNNPESPQIVGVSIRNKMPMGDIVCYENHPFEHPFELSYWPR